MNTRYQATPVACSFKAAQFLRSLRRIWSSLIRMPIKTKNFGGGSPPPPPQKPASSPLRAAPNQMPQRPQEQGKQPGTFHVFRGKPAAFGMPATDQCQQRHTGSSGQSRGTDQQLKTSPQRRLRWWPSFSAISPLERQPQRKGTDGDRSEIASHLQQGGRGRRDSTRCVRKTRCDQPSTVTIMIPPNTRRARPAGPAT